MKQLILRLFPEIVLYLVSYCGFYDRHFIITVNRYHKNQGLSVRACRQTKLLFRSVLYSNEIGLNLLSAFLFMWKARIIKGLVYNALKFNKLS